MVKGVEIHSGLKTMNWRKTAGQRVRYTQNIDFDRLSQTGHVISVATGILQELVFSSNSPF